MVVAAASYQKPRVPEFARELGTDVVQMHSHEYRNPAQLPDGAVLLVGAGNSGAEIAMDLARTHKVYLSGRDVGHVPFNIEGFAGRKLLVRLVIRGLFHRVLTIRTPMGRKFRSKMHGHGMPLVRTRPGQLERAGVRRIGKITGVRGGRPVSEDGTEVGVRHRDLVHRLPFRFRLDRPAGARRTRHAPPPLREGERHGRALLHRTSFPVRGVIDARLGRWARRAPRRGLDCGAVTDDPTSASQRSPRTQGGKPMKRLLTAAILVCVPADSFAETVVVPSAGSVPETVERLKASVEDAGARVFSVVDFGGKMKVSDVRSRSKVPVQPP